VSDPGGHSAEKVESHLHHRRRWNTPRCLGPHSGYMWSLVACLLCAGPHAPCFRTNVSPGAKAAGLEVAIACVPKTIDNDVPLIDKSFGFDTAVEQAVSGGCGNNNKAHHRIGVVLSE